MVTEPNELSDEQLNAALTRTQQGDHDAFAEIVEALQWPLRCWLAVRCTPEVDPDEIAHVAFVEAFRCRDRYAPGTSVRAWIWGIARNKLLAELALARRRNACQLSAEVLLTQVDADTPPAVGDEAREVLVLRRCLTRLTSSARDILSRHYDHGQPLAEIATVLGRTVAAIKKALFVSRRRLQQCVEAGRAEATP